MLWVRDHLAALEIRVITAFPRSRLVPIGSYSRGTAIAVHSNVDTLAVLPREWATWGARRVAPQMVIQRMVQELSDQRYTAGIRRDGRAVALSFAGSNHYPVYSVPGADLRWVDVSPQCHDALF